MKTNVNPLYLSRLLIGSTKRWVIQGGVFVPFTAVIPGQAITYWLAERFPRLAAKKIILVTTSNGRKAYWIYDEDEFEEKGYWCFSHPGYVRKAHQQWQKDLKCFDQAVNQLQNADVKKNPLRSFKRFYKTYLDEYSVPLSTEYFSLGGDKFIRELKKKYPGYNRLDKDIVAFTKPPKLSFLQRYELALLTLALLFWPGRVPTRLDELQSSFPKAHQALDRIRRKYFWIRFDYRDTVPLDASFFFRQLQTVLKKGRPWLRRRQRELRQYETSLVRNQAKIKKSSRLTAKEIAILKSIGFAGHWQDERKRANLIANYWCQRFIRLFAKELHCPVGDVWHMTQRELFAAYRGKRVPKDELQRRKSWSFYYVIKDGREAMVSQLKYRKIWNAIRSQNLPQAASTLSGIGASAGVARGTVRIIENPKEQGKNLKPGDILVTYMTRPDFVPLMHRAGAIVTDEGGLTSHATIIARELKIPCVVGTRFAMRVLKDGDRVEVDAVHGIVKRIR